MMMLTHMTIISLNNDEVDTHDNPDHDDVVDDEIEATLQPPLFKPKNFSD